MDRRATILAGLPFRPPGVYKTAGQDHMMGLHRAVIARQSVAPLLLLGVATKATWQNFVQIVQRSERILAGTADACRLRMLGRSYGEV